jgi:hypothetical protein
VTRKTSIEKRSEAELRATLEHLTASLRFAPNSLLAINAFLRPPESF